jgi:hypothetical protein
LNAESLVGHAEREVIEKTSAEKSKRHPQIPREYVRGDEPPGSADFNPPERRIERGESVNARDAAISDISATQKYVRGD